MPNPASHATSLPPTTVDGSHLPGMPAADIHSASKAAHCTPANDGDPCGANVGQVSALPLSLRQILPSETLVSGRQRYAPSTDASQGVQTLQPPVKHMQLAAYEDAFRRQFDIPHDHVMCFTPDFSGKMFRLKHAPSQQIRAWIPGGASGQQHEHMQQIEGITGQLLCETFRHYLSFREGGPVDPTAPQAPVEVWPQFPHAGSADLSKTAADPLKPASRSRDSRLHAAGYAQQMVVAHAVQRNEVQEVQSTSNLPAQTGDDPQPGPDLLLLHMAVTCVPSDGPQCLCPRQASCCMLKTFLSKPALSATSGDAMRNDAASIKPLARVTDSGADGNKKKRNGESSA